MNLDSIKAGDKIKNYKELCKILQMDITTGKSKILQLENLKRFILYEMSGREFIIKSIYKNPIEKEKKKRGGNNLVYIEHLELLILNHLASRRYAEEFNIIEMTTKEIAIVTGMCKRDYINKTFEEIKREHPEITQYDNSELRRRFESKINKTIDVMLDSLVRDFILYRYHGHKIKRMESENNYFWMRATEQEEVLIMNAKREVLKLMKKDTDSNNPTMHTIINRFQVEEFYDLLNEYLKEKYQWEEIYRTYFLAFSKNLDRDIQDFIKSKPELQKQKIELNTKIVKYIDNQADDIYAKNKKKYDESLSKVFDERPFKLKSNYADNQKTLSKALLKMNDNKQ